MRATAHVAAVLPWILVSSCTHRGPEVGGASGTAALFDGSRARCSAVVIAPHWAVTAAHCVGFPDEHAEDVLRRMSLRVPGPDGWTESAIRRRWIHPGYSAPSLTHDLAVLELKTAIPGSAVARPPGGMCAEPLLQRGVRVRLAGFGATGKNPDPLGFDPGIGVLRVGEAEISEVTSRQIATVPAPHTTCTADSGGGVFVDTACGAVLVAIISAGSEDCRGRAAHTRIAGHLDFIERVADPR